MRDEGTLVLRLISSFPRDTMIPATRPVTSALGEKSGHLSR